MKRSIAVLLMVVTLLTCCGFAPAEEPVIPVLGSAAEQTASDGIIIPSAQTTPLSETQTAAADDADLLVGASSYPAQFDSRMFGYITSVKNQANAGICWSFTQNAIIEAHLQKEQYSHVEYDFSEKHMAYSNSTAGGNAWGFKRNPLFDNVGGYNTAGGNQYLSTAYLARGSGAVREDEDTLTYKADGTVIADNNRTAADNDLRFSDGYLEEAILLTDPTVEQVKGLIYENGAAGVNVYWHDDFYNASTKGYFYTTKGSTAPAVNHAITLIGWDDNYAASNFKPVASAGKYWAPSENGAFIVKNSWGTSFGDGGYCYISYADFYLLDSAYTSYYEIVDVPFDGIDQYDELGYNQSMSYPVSTNRSAVYATTFERDAAEKVEGIGTYVLDGGSKLEIYVNPYNGSCTDTGKMVKVHTETFARPGYYHISFDEAVQLYGTNYAVLVKVTNKSISPNIPFQAATSLAAPKKFYAKTFYMGMTMDQMTVIDDFGDYIKTDKFALCLKAFTQSDLKVEVSEGSLGAGGAIALHRGANMGGLTITRNGEKLKLYSDKQCTVQRNSAIYPGDYIYAKVENGTHQRLNFWVYRSDASNLCKLLTVDGKTYTSGIPTIQGKTVSSGVKNYYTATVSEGATYKLYALPGGIGEIGEKYSARLYPSRAYLRVTAEDGIRSQEYPVLLKPSVTNSTTGFSDIKTVGSWAKTAMNEALKSGWVRGNGAGKLVPKNSLSRAEAATMLLQFSGISFAAVNTGSADRYADVKKGDWYYNVVDAATVTGMIAGSYDTGWLKFNPKKSVTRQEFMVMIVQQLAWLEGKDQTAYMEHYLALAKKNVNTKLYADYSKVPAWARDYVLVALYLGVVSGRQQNGKLYISPTGTITREETVQILYNCRAKTK